ncbi:hypothetical protein N7G274_003344 [Stereocaulon virgatum]|uniref:Uncharacterized protein n=1 Tax=Stereocaulon virgatum TaxID=373712 RepID=A0ABR4AEE7_9LECA
MDGTFATITETDTDWPGLSTAAATTTLVETYTYAPAAVTTAVTGYVQDSSGVIATDVELQVIPDAAPSTVLIAVYLEPALASKYTSLGSLSRQPSTTSRTTTTASSTPKSSRQSIVTQPSSSLSAPIRTSQPTPMSTSAPVTSSLGLSPSTKTGIGLGVPLGALALGILVFAAYRVFRSKQHSRQMHKDNIANTDLPPTLDQGEIGLGVGKSRQDGRTNNLAGHDISEEQARDAPGRELRAPPRIPEMQAETRWGGPGVMPTSRRSELA